MYKRSSLFLIVLLVSCSNLGTSVVNHSDISNVAPDDWLSAASNRSSLAEPSDHLKKTKQASSVTASFQLHTELPPKLHLLIEEAVMHNRDLQVAARRVDVVAAGNKISASQLWPSISAGLSGTSTESFDDSEKAFYESYSTGLSISWEVDIWGQIRDASTAAQRDFDAELLIYEAARQSLSANVVLAWLTVLETQQLYTLAQKNLFIQQQRLEQLEQRLDRGLIEPLDVRLTRNNVANLEDRLLEQDANYHSSLRRLEILLGRYPQAQTVSLGLLPVIEPFNPVTAPADVLQLRPDIRAAEQTLLGENLRVQEAKKKLWPSLNLNASLGADESEFSSLFDFERWLSSFSASLLQPIFQGGALRAVVTQHQARAQMAVAQYQQLVLEAWEEVEGYLYDEHIFLARIQALDKALIEAVSVEELTLRKYEQGLTSSFELLTAQNRSISAEAELIQIRIESVANRIRLHLALGVNLDT